MMTASVMRTNALMERGLKLNRALVVYRCLLPLPLLLQDWWPLWTVNFLSDVMSSLCSVIKKDEIMFCDKEKSALSSNEQEDKHEIKTKLPLGSRECGVPMAPLSFV